MVCFEYELVKYSTHIEIWRCSLITLCCTQMHCFALFFQTSPQFFVVRYNDNKNVKNIGKISLDASTAVIVTWRLMSSLSPGRMFGIFSSVRHFSTEPTTTRLKKKINMM